MIENFEIRLLVCSYWPIFFQFSDFWTFSESQEKKRNENVAENKFKNFFMKVMAWNFSTRVIVCSNMFAELGVIIFIVFFIMSRMFYRKFHK